MTTQEEVPTQRFYLRKIEGAEILLAWETNFFRQELHRWAPVASEPPPLLEYSLSTRKPRPTKQQKLMAQLGVDNPEDLPQDLRTKAHTFGSSRRKSSEPHAKVPPLLQPALGGPAIPSSCTTPTMLGPSMDGINHSNMAVGNGLASFGQGLPLAPNESSFTFEGSFRLPSPGVGSPGLPSASGYHAMRSQVGSPGVSPSSPPLSRSLSLALAPPPFTSHDGVGSSGLDRVLLNGNHLESSNHGSSSHLGSGVATMVSGVAIGSSGLSDFGEQTSGAMNGIEGMEGGEMGGASQSGNMDSIFADLTNQDADGLEGSSPPPQIPIPAPVPTPALAPPREEVVETTVTEEEREGKGEGENQSTSKMRFER